MMTDTQRNKLISAAITENRERRRVDAFRQQRDTGMRSVGGHRLFERDHVFIEIFHELFARSLILSRNN